MKKVLLPFQNEGADWLASRPHRTALLADEMGLGKTIQAVEAVRRLGLTDVTVICPAVAKHNWRNTFDEVFDGQLSVLPVDDKTRFAPPAQVEIYSYDFATSDYSSRAMTRKGQVCIIDESHYLANDGAQRTQHVLGVNLDRADAIAHKGYEHVWAISGTPMRRDPTSLYPLLRSLYPRGIAMDTGAPMPYSAFVSMYCEGYKPRGKERYVITGGKNLDRLARDIGPFFLRRRADDLGLPPIMFDEFPIEIESWRLPGFKGMPEGFDGDDDEYLREVRSLGDQARWRKELARAKAGACAHLIRAELDLMLYDKIVVFAWHTEALDALQRIVGRCVRVDGKTSPREKEAAEDRFNNDPKINMFLGQIEAAGTSLSLTAAHNELFVELDWTPALNAQAAMRTRRIGQKKTTFCRMAVTQDPMDQRLTSVLLRKTQDEVALFGESVSTQMAGALQ